MMFWIFWCAEKHYLSRGNQSSDLNLLRKYIEVFKFVDLFPTRHNSYITVHNSISFIIKLSPLKLFFVFENKRLKLSWALTSWTMPHQKMIEKHLLQTCTFNFKRDNKKEWLKLNFLSKTGFFLQGSLNLNLKLKVHYFIAKNSLEHKWKLAFAFSIELLCNKINILNVQ